MMLLYNFWQLFSISRDIIFLLLIYFHGVKRATSVAFDLISCDLMRLCLHCRSIKCNLPTSRNGVDVGHFAFYVCVCNWNGIKPSSYFVFCTFATKLQTAKLYYKFPGLLQLQWYDHRPGYFLQRRRRRRHHRLCDWLLAGRLLPLCLMICNLVSCMTTQNSVHGFMAWETWLPQN